MTIKEREKSRKISVRFVEVKKTQKKRKKKLKIKMKFSLLWIALVILLATHVSENATADDDEWWRSGVVS